MSRVPTYQSRVPTPSGMMVVPSLPDDMAAAGAGLQNVAQVVGGIAELVTESQREIDLTRYMTEAQETLAKAEDEASQLPPGQMLAKLNESSERFFRETSAKISDRVVKQDFELSFRQMQSMARIEVGRSAMAKTKAVGRAQLDAYLATTAPRIAAARNDVERKELIEQAYERIERFQPFIGDDGVIQKTAALNGLIQKLDVDQDQAAMESNITALQKVSGSTTDPKMFEAAKRRLKATIDAATGTVLDKTAAGDRLRAEAANLTVAHFHALIEEDPERAERFIKSEGRAAGVNPRTIAMLADEAVVETERQQRADAGSAFQRARELIDTQLSPDNRAFDPDALAPKIDSIVREVMAMPAMQRQGTLFQNRVATPDDLKRMLLEPHLSSAALDGDRLRLEAVAKAMPDSPEARIEIQRAGDVLSRVDDGRRRAAEGVGKLATEFHTGHVAADSPNDDGSLDRFYETLKGENVPWAEVTEHMAMRAGKGLNMPSGYVKDLRATFDPADQRFDLAAGVMAVRMIGGQNRGLAARMVRGWGSELAATAVGATRHLDPASGEFERRLTVLGQPRAESLVQGASRFIVGDKEAKIAAMDVPGTLNGSLQLKGAAVTADVRAAFEDQFRFAMADLSLSNNESDLGKMLPAAKRRAAQAVAESFVAVKVPEPNAIFSSGDVHQLAPGNLGLGSKASPSTATLAQLEGVIRARMDADFPDPMVGGREGLVRADLAMKLDAMLYVPITDTAGDRVKAYIEFNPADGTGRTVTGKSDSTVFGAVETIRAAHVDPAEIQPYSHLRWRSEHGDRTPLEVDGPNSRSGIAAGIAQLAQVQFMQTHGHPPDAQDADQRQEFELIARRIAMRFGWRMLQAPEREADDRDDDE